MRVRSVATVLTLALGVAGCASTAQRPADITQLSVVDAAQLIRDKKVTSVELTQAYLQVTGQGRDKGRSAEELEADLQAEVADVLAMLLLFARHHGVDVNEALERKWVAYRAANLSR